MRKFEINVPDATLTDISRAILAEEFDFVVKATNEEEIVKVEIPYDKDRNDSITDLEEDLNQIVEDYYEEEKNS